MLKIAPAISFVVGAAYLWGRICSCFANVMMDALEEIDFRVASVVIVTVFEFGIIPGIIVVVVIVAINSVPART